MEKDEPLKVEMEVTDFLLSRFMEDYQIEILQGVQTRLPNDMIKVNFQLQGENKRMFQDFMKMLMSIPSDKIKVKYFGSQLNPN